jgi:pSer/pThr/pTyr-binding forkhead associated (FHA) protein
MAAFVEVWGHKGPELVPLQGERATIGRAEGNDVVLGDTTVSGTHAVLQRYPAGWTLRDLGSANGTFINGDRVTGERRVGAGDELRLGSTRLVFRSDAKAAEPTLRRDEAPPRLTPRERDVLVALCRSLAAGDVFTEPASVEEIAAELFVSAAAVKLHLANLYSKFGVDESERSRRARLANEAFRRHAVTLADLRP